MDKFIPTEVKDLTESKKRVMRNVLNEVQNRSKKPKHNWRYVVIAAVVTMSAMFFVLSEVLTENEPSVAEQPSPTELDIDFSKPEFSEEQGLFYLDGVTLGDSKSKVIEVFGENFTIVQEDDSEADVILDYEGLAKFSFIEDKLDSIVFMNVDEDYLIKLFNDYDGFKFIDFHIYDDRFFYSNGTNQIVRASPQPINENLSLTLSNAEPHWEKKIAENLYKAQQNINNQHISPINTDIDFAKPTFTEEEGYLYFHGVTLGDSPSKVIELLGDNYIIGQADGSGSDFLLNYDRLASFHFYNDKLDSIVLIKVDKEYFDALFNHYEGFKFIYSGREDDNDRIIYSEETYQVMKATTQTPNKELYLYIGYPGPELWDNPEMKGIPNPWEQP
ncbi:hypothetical protein QTL97_17380 [Sporosarcina thermotolerans]|uniref:DUF4179 domain-containing protein n=1 Tax=Sporosarcina thermotolerans TaxID=633404 RepID=A0AAW9AER0_9BACL|nr:hypothetical protein [Sporosarcina thermotolerans]MDW0118699.1 hypothetical protein [Sporosarcina thermotolerans]WHT48656.1 hypothetical protein QNH10_02330 [Sporosarcina thermotolerans]